MDGAVESTDHPSSPVQAIRCTLSTCDVQHSQVLCAADAWKQRGLSPLTTSGEVEIASHWDVTFPRNEG